MASSIKIPNSNYIAKNSFMRNSNNNNEAYSRFKTPYEMIQFTQSISPKKNIKNVNQKWLSTILGNISFTKSISPL